MSKIFSIKPVLIRLLWLAALPLLACNISLFGSQVEPTATPTKTPKSAETVQEVAAAPTDTPVSPTDEPPTPVPTDTPIPTEIPTEVPSVTPLPSTEVPPTETPTEAPPADTPTPAPPTATPKPTATTAPAFDYIISHYKVLGEGENNGGIFNKGGQHLIFLTVVDASGNGIDGAVVKDANGSNLEIITGSKGPGKAEITMEWEPFKLHVTADPTGPKNSQISNQMNTAFPHIPDVVGKLGPADNPASVCPTIDFQCEPPFYSVHFSYEITFQRTY